MDALLDFLAETTVANGTLTMAVLVFAATAIPAFGVMGLVRTRGDVKRRAAEAGSGTAAVNSSSNNNNRSLRYASIQAAQRLVEYTNRHFSGEAKSKGHALRTRLIQAGFLDARAGAFYFLTRTAAAVVLALAAALLVPTLLPTWPNAFWPGIWLSGCLGYLLPKVYLDRRIAKRRAEHRAGFPDFMDLLVVCANAGLSMEAALDRVGRELSDSYPSLSSNIYMMTLELRAGRTIGEALDHLSERLGLEEARGFATLLQQSEELGSSLTDTLRVYSDDMRHKRMSIAEEKAYSLPAKLSVPLILCIFPVIIVVILLPVYVQIKYIVH
jgi:tight adherence protein C